jgi:hypothetical protein
VRILSGHQIPLLSQQQQLRLEQLARDVEAHLKLVGLPVNWQGNSAIRPIPKIAGVRIFYDPSADSSGGVYVKWRVSSEILRDAMTQGPDSHPAVIGGISMDVMLDALGRLLSSAGWAIQRMNTGVHESSIKVVGMASNEWDAIGEIQAT